MPFESLNLGKLNSGKTIRAIVQSVTNNRTYNNSGASAGTTEVWDDASVADYAIVVAELGTSGIYTFSTPASVNFEYVFHFYEAPGGTIDLTRYLGSGYGKARVIVESYVLGTSPAEQILNNPANQLDVDSTGGVKVYAWGTTTLPVGVDGVPIVDVRYVNGLPAEEVDQPFAIQGVFQAVLTNPRYQTRNLPPMAQGSEPIDIWAITDPQGVPIDLSGKTIRLVAYLRTDPGTDQESILDDTLEGAFQYETGGDGITVGGTGNNEVMLEHDAGKTGVAGEFYYFLWSVTDRLVLAKGRMPIEPAVFEALV